jgi:hypothetical protein
MHGRRRFATRVVPLLAATLTLLDVACPRAAQAAQPAPHWHILTRSAPSTLVPGQHGEVIAILANLGDAPLEASVGEPVKIADVLPPGVSATGEMVAKPEYGNNGVLNTPVIKCPELRCTYVGTLPPLISIELQIPVEAAKGIEGALGDNLVTVAGGVEGHTAPAAEGSGSLKVGTTPVAFGVERYELTPEAESGATDVQAGSHPSQITTTIAFNQIFTELNPGREFPVPDVPQLVKTIDTTLPPGLVGNANGYVVPRCSGFDFGTVPEGNYNECPEDTAIGAALVTFHDQAPGPGYLTETVPVFNIEPEAGEPARFGFEFERVPVILNTAVQTGKGYAIEVSSANVSSTASVLSTIVTIWGTPRSEVHDDARGWQCLGGGFKLEIQGGSHKQPCVEEAMKESEVHPYLTLPTTCAAPTSSSLQVESWQSREVAPAALGSADSVQLSGCDELPFEGVSAPSIAVQPDESAASTPSGLKVELHVPQQTTLANGELAESDLSQNTVALPEGLETNPGGANGLETCPDIGLEAGFAEAAQLDNDHFDASAPTCPNGSKLGAVTIHSPLLEDPLEGEVFLARQDTDPFVSPLVLYLVAEDKPAGVLVKLAGEVNISPTGQLVTTFKNTPPVPFEELELNLSDGPRASQSTPALCRIYTTTAEFVPSSGEAPTTSASSFRPTPNADGVPCPESGPLAFSPSLQAGSTNKQAGAFTPFTLTIARPDGDAPLKTISMQLPAGLAALIGSVPLCEEPQAAQGTCDPASLIGHSTVLAGLGSAPYTLSGDVYLTGPYDGAPFGLATVTDASHVGQFGIGTIVARSTINVNELTAAASIDTEAVTVFPAGGGAPEQFAGLPERIKGLPSQIKELNVTVERPGFEFNPTNCTRTATTGTLTGYEGASEPVSPEFEVTNCAALPFAPKLTATVVGQGSKANGTTFAVRIESPGLGQANIHKVDLTIPASLPSRLTTIQKACLEAVFNANPGSCDEGSVIGEGIVRTPVFKNPLKGPAYLVSHGNAAFPDVEFVLQGEGVTLIVDGKTYIHRGVTYSKFETSPDAPFTTFESIFPAGPHSALTPNVPEHEDFNLCKTKLTLPTELTGQNGAFISRATKVAVTGCKGVAAFKATRAQLLAKALKACKQDKKQGKRVACEKRARKRYGAKHKKAAKKRYPGSLSSERHR